jgi:hypothetical protein
MPKVKNINGRLAVQIGQPLILHYGCFECKHFNEIERTCPAFPVEIPEKFIKGVDMHRDVKPEQEGKTIFEFIGDQGLLERKEKFRMILVLEKLIAKYENSDRLITRGGFDVEEILGMRKGLVFAITEICKAFGIDVNEKIKPGD